MLSQQVGHQPLNHGLLVEVAMHHKARCCGLVPQRDAGDGIAAAQGLLPRGEPGIDHPLLQQGCEVIGLADAGAANGPDPCEVFREGGFRAEGRLQSQILAKFAAVTIWKMQIQDG